MYANERGWEIEDTYIDDGISGTTFDRPGFQRLIDDIEKKRINMVIVKDLSRLGRNYSQVGHYTDFFLPKHNVRFIAIGDNVDSEKDNDLTGFLNVIHEHYAKDTSRKIKTTKKTQMKKGEFIGSQPAMGYKRVSGTAVIRRIRDIGAAHTAIRAKPLATFMPLAKMSLKSLCSAKSRSSQALRLIMLMPCLISCLRLTTE